jgi:hypothetical protein
MEPTGRKFQRDAGLLETRAACPIGQQPTSWCVKSKGVRQKQRPTRRPVLSKLVCAGQSWADQGCGPGRPAGVPPGKKRARVRVTALEHRRRVRVTLTHAGAAVEPQPRKTPNQMFIGHSGPLGDTACQGPGHA